MQNNQKPKTRATVVPIYMNRKKFIDIFEPKNNI